MNDEVRLAVAARNVHAAFAPMITTALHTEVEARINGSHNLADQIAVVVNQLRELSESASGEALFYASEFTRIHRIEQRQKGTA